MRTHLGIAGTVQCHDITIIGSEKFVGTGKTAGIPEQLEHHVHNGIGVIVVIGDDFQMFFLIPEKLAVVKNLTFCKGGDTCIFQFRIVFRGKGFESRFCRG